MAFLDRVWEALEGKKSDKFVNPDLQVKQVYPGYRMIPIQKLYRKQTPISKPIDGVKFWDDRRRVVTYEQNAKPTHRASNGFWSAFYDAYMSHGDLKIKPDQVWMTIMLYFTKYVNDNAQELRRAFVSHEGKKELIIQTRSSDEKEWEEFYEKVIEEIRKNTHKGVTEKLECNFTSTGYFERVFSTAIVMNSFKKYFDYTRMGGGCGIQNIHMAGTVDDWMKLKTKLKGLGEFDVNGQLKKYIRGLQPVLDQFVETFKGYAHLQFWNNLYERRENPHAQEYMPTSWINGWLTKFFTTQENVTEELQIEQICVPIKYINLDTGTTTMFDLVGGCKAYCLEDGKVYRPHFSFVIAEDLRQAKKKVYTVPKPKPVIPRQPLKLGKTSFTFQSEPMSKSSLIHSRMKSKR